MKDLIVRIVFHRYYVLFWILYFAGSFVANCYRYAHVPCVPLLIAILINFLGFLLFILIHEEGGISGFIIGTLEKRAHL